MSYPAFGKIPRLHKDIYVTEKIDGTNGLVAVLNVDELRCSDRACDAPAPPAVAEAANGLCVAAGSRNRWISPDADNHGFAAWVFEHADELAEGLGAGLHYGEWYGLGIQRGYGLARKRFALFNSARWESERPACCDVVPTLVVTTGHHMSDAVRGALEDLHRNGSRVAPGFMRPEGVIVYHSAARQSFKALLENDDIPKGAGVVYHDRLGLSRVDEVPHPGLAGITEKRITAGAAA